MTRSEEPFQSDPLLAEAVARAALMYRNLRYTQGGSLYTAGARAALFAELGKWEAQFEPDAAAFEDAQSTAGVHHD